MSFLQSKNSTNMTSVQLINSNKKRFYYDVNITNNIYTNPNASLFPANFQETRDQPLFEDAPSKYCLSVLRFSIPTDNIPYQIVPVIYDSVDTNNPNNTIYSITMKYNGIYYTQNIQWVSQYANIPTPTAPLLVPVSSNKDLDYYLYYSLFSLGHLCDLINTALNDCYQNNIVPLLTPPPAGKSYISPYMSFDGLSSYFTLWIPQNFLYDEITSSYLIELGGNYLFQSLFSRSFSTLTYGRQLINKLDFRFNLINTNVNQIPNDIDPDGFVYRFLQEGETTGNISKFQSILITSNMLPVISSNVSNTATSLSVGSVGGGFLPIITDFETDRTSFDNVRINVQYNPTGEFRRINLRGNTPITHIDISIFYKDTFGSIYPLIMPENTTATIKILFEEQ